MTAKERLNHYKETGTFINPNGPNNLDQAQLFIKLITRVMARHDLAPENEVWVIDAFYAADMDRFPGDDCERTPLQSKKTSYWWSKVNRYIDLMKVKANPNSTPEEVAAVEQYHEWNIKQKEISLTAHIMQFGDDDSGSDGDPISLHFKSYEGLKMTKPKRIF